MVLREDVTAALITHFEVKFVRVRDGVVYIESISQGMVTSASKSSDHVLRLTILIEFTR